MEVRDRKMLARLMVVQGISQRQLAKQAGWKTHAYLNRLLKGDAKTLETDPALRIAYALGVGVEDLFLTKMTTANVQANNSADRRRAA